MKGTKYYTNWDIWENIFFLLFVCVFNMCMWWYTHAYMHSYTDTYPWEPGEARRGHWVSCSISLCFILLRQGLSLNLVIRLAASKPQLFPCLCPYSTPPKCPSTQSWGCGPHSQLRVRHPWSVCAPSSRLSGIRQVPKSEGLALFASLRSLLSTSM